MNYVTCEVRDSNGALTFLSARNVYRLLNNYQSIRNDIVAKDIARELLDVGIVAIDISSSLDVTNIVTIRKLTPKEVRFHYYKNFNHSITMNHKIEDLFLIDFLCDVAINNDVTDAYIINTDIGELHIPIDTLKKFKEYITRHVDPMKVREAITYKYALKGELK